MNAVKEAVLHLLLMFKIINYEILLLQFLFQFSLFETHIYFHYLKAMTCFIEYYICMN